MSQASKLLIVGASTRAAAFSAARAGLPPRCVDHFADRDLTALYPVCRVANADGVAGLEGAAMAQPAHSLIYSGPVENHAAAVERLSARHQVLGNSAATLRAVRDPFRVHAALRRHGLPVPDVRAVADGLPRDGSWIIKPIASGGGRHVRLLGNASSRAPAEPCYLQQRIAGPCLAALYLAGAGRSELIGVTRQLTGAPMSPFAYRGSVGPVPVADDLAAALAVLGRVLTACFNLIGLFGVDFLVRDDQPWPVEVNPRYTASVEVLELALGQSLLDLHVRACRKRAIEGTGAPIGSPPARVVGKVILFAERDGPIPHIPLPAFRPTDPYGIPDIADVPPPMLASAGDPIMTVFATGPDVESCTARLLQAEARWREIIAL